MYLATYSFIWSFNTNLHKYCRIIDVSFQHYFYPYILMYWITQYFASFRRTSCGAWTTCCSIFKLVNNKKSAVDCKEKSNAQRNNRQTKFWREKVLEDDELPGNVTHLYRFQNLINTSVVHYNLHSQKFRSHIQNKVLHTSPNKPPKKTPLYSIPLKSSY